jgi:anti-sigma regulatory factor (Ser/Thr protein kinase)
MHNKYIPITKQDKGDYIKQSIDYLSLMKRHIRKHHSYMQPIFEAISNAFEATNGQGDTITVRLRLRKVIDKLDFQPLEIEDTGIGFNNINFERLQRLYDESKNNNNLGTGRIQYLHFFDKTDIYSVYEEDGTKYKRRIVLSANFYPLNKGVIWASEPEVVDNATRLGTSVAFFYPLDEGDQEYYGNLTSEDIYRVR